MQKAHLSHLRRTWGGDPPQLIPGPRPHCLPKFWRWLVIVSRLWQSEAECPLQEVVAAMKRHKCPGPHGAPVELFQTMWATAGPLILIVLNEGITAGTFHEFFSQGLIVLLPKKGDQRLLQNKRPIMLLNAVYKIGAKVMQRRLTPILQKTISPSNRLSCRAGASTIHSLCWEKCLIKRPN